MHYLFSSIAWKRDQATAVASRLRQGRADGIEASPGLFDRPLAELSSAHIREVRAFWEGEGLPVRAMQALLFGRPELHLFGTEAERQTLAEHLRLVFRVAGQLGGGPLVFGSPKNRLRGDLEPDEAFARAITFFATLAPDAADEGCTLCIEANAPAYSCDWITTHAEAVDLVQAVDYSGFGLQVDTGVMQLNGETPEDLADLLRTAQLLPSHVHASEPHLVSVNAANTLHHRLGSVLRSLGYTGGVSVEMKAAHPETFTTVINGIRSAYTGTRLDTNTATVPSLGKESQ